MKDNQSLIDSSLTHDTPDCSKLDDKENDCLQRNLPRVQWCDSCTQYEQSLVFERNSSVTMLIDMLSLSEYDFHWSEETLRNMAEYTANRIIYHAEFVLSFFE